MPILHYFPFSPSSPPFLPACSLDVGTEAAIQAALSAVRAGRTVLLIAHRLSTVKDAQQILVVRRGGADPGGSLFSYVAATFPRAPAPAATARRGARTGAGHARGATRPARGGVPGHVAAAAHGADGGSDGFRGNRSCAGDCCSGGYRRGGGALMMSDATAGTLPTGTTLDETAGTMNDSEASTSLAGCGASATVVLPVAQ